MTRWETKDIFLKREVVIPPSSDTSSMSEVTDIRCAVRRGDFEGAASPLGVSAAACTSLGRLGTSGTGESALPSWTVDDEEPGLLMSDRDDRERSECESGRGVTSEASSKLSCTSTRDQHTSMALAVNWVYAPHPYQNCASWWAGRCGLRLLRRRPWQAVQVPDVRSKEVTGETAQRADRRALLSRN